MTLTPTVARTDQPVLPLLELSMVKPVSVEELSVQFSAIALVDCAVAVKLVGAGKAVQPLRQKVMDALDAEILEIVIPVWVITPPLYVSVLG